MKSKKSAPPLVKVVLEVDDESGTWANERVWAEPVAPGRYRIANVPFLVDDVSYGDIVFAEPVGGDLVVTGVSIRAGHSTFLIAGRRTAKVSDIERAWGELAALGCMRERRDERTFAVDVPSRTDVAAVRRILGRGVRRRLWKFDATACGHFT